MRKIIVMALASMLIAGGLVGCAQPNAKEYKEMKDFNSSQSKQDVKISTEEAIQIALAQHDGTVTEAELDRNDNGQVVYELDVITKDAKYEIDIDPDSGKVIKDRKEQDDPEDRARADEAKLSITEALQIAEKEVGGNVTEIDLDRVHGELIYEVEVETKSGKEYDLDIDAKTGDIIRKENG